MSFLCIIFAIYFLSYRGGSFYFFFISCFFVGWLVFQGRYNCKLKFTRDSTLPVATVATVAIGLSLDVGVNVDSWWKHFAPVYADPLRALCLLPLCIHDILLYFVNTAIEQPDGAAVFVAVIVWFTKLDDRREDALIRAWQVILDAHGKSGDGGRTRALEFLNNSKCKQKYGIFGETYPKEDLAHVNLSNANLKGANLQGAELYEANLEGANLGEANLRGANLEGANLQGANLWGANLQEADLRVAKLKGADLQFANLQRAELGEAKLQGAELMGANLEGADLRGAKLKGAKYNSKLYNSFIERQPTIFPDGFDPKTEEMIDVSEETPTAPNSSQTPSIGFFAAVGGERQTKRGEVSDGVNFCD